MPDHSFAGGADTTVGPVPGYYADPSIPGFVRYWGGSAWVPGTSRPTPAEGEVLEPPRFVTRPAAARQAGARSADARPVPPPTRPVPPPTAGSGAGAAAGAGGAGAAVGGAVAGAAGGGGVAETGTGPVFFDQTSAGTSFSMAPQAELELRRRADVEARAQLQAQLPVQAQWGGPPFSAPLPAHGSGPSHRPASSPGVLGLPPGSALQQYADLLADPPAAVGNELPGPDRQGAAASGWQADPRAQRGLMETGGSPRWVSWGVLPGADESRSDQEETPGQVVEEAPQVVEQVVEEAPGQVVEQLVESVETEAAPAEMLPEVAAEPVAEPAVTRTVPAPGRLRPTVISIPAPSAARAAAAGRAPATASAAAGRPAAVRRPAPRPAAGLGRRLAARVVDTVVMAVVAVAAGLPLASSATAHIETKLARATMVSNLAGRQMQVWLVDGVVLGKAAALLGILLLAGFLYEVLPTARTGQTFGKRLLGIRVIDARPAPRAPARRTAARAAAERPGPLRPPTVGRSFVRWIVRQLAAALVIGLCWPLLDRTARRGWQDRAARTKVVKA